MHAADGAATRRPIIRPALVWVGIALALCGGASQAIEVNGNVFLQGDFVEVGIHPAGSFGSDEPAPAGFHPKLDSSTLLGFVADPQRDGWTSGTPPQTGDYFVPGTPEEGWSIEWTVGGVERAFHNYGLMGLTQVVPASLTETSDAGSQSALWEGTATDGSAQVRVLQTVRVDPTTLYFVMGVTLTNTGSVALDSVEYLRNVDPDQEQPITGDFTTSNYVALQPGVSGNPDRALVVARGLVHGLTLGLGAIDARAVVSTEGFSNRDPDAILDSPTNACTQAAPCVADQAIALAFRFGTLAPGQSVSFDYAYILNEDDLDEALGDLAAVTILQPVGTVSGDSVLFQATTDDVANTVQVEFFVAGVSVGVDTTPGPGGVFAITFDSTGYPNGPLGLEAVATFGGGATVGKTGSVTVDNSGPPIAFAEPSSGQVFNGTGIAIAITVLDPLQPPVEVSFFRETAGSGSLFLGADASAPFAATFDVTDLPEGETVVIKAVARDALNRTTTIQVAGVTGVCGNGSVDPGEQCDDGNTLDGDCCSASCTFETLGTSCEDGLACTAGACDGAGLCIQAARPAGTVCRESQGECDIEEQCDGLSSDCPPDETVAAGTPCTDDGSACSVDQCDGAGACAHMPGHAGLECRPAAGACDAAEQCTGSDVACPADALAPPATVCRAAASPCDAAEQCSGVDASCPADVLRPDGTSCEDGNLCLGGDQCSAGVCVAGSLPVTCDDGSSCTADVCQPASGCVHTPTPLTGCRASARASLRWRDAGDDGRDTFAWRWLRGTAAADDLADPTTDARYDLCVFAGATPVLVAEANLAPGTHWKSQLRQRFKYRDGAGSVAGIRHVGLKSSPRNGARLLVSGRGVHLADPALDTLEAPLVVQLRNQASEICFESRFGTADLRVQNARELRATRR